MSSRLDVDLGATAVDPPSFMSSEVPLWSRMSRRLPFKFIQPAALVGDFLIVMLASLVGGIVYHWLVSNTIGPIDKDLAIGVLVFANFAALLSAQHNYRITSLTNIARQSRYVTF